MSIENLFHPQIIVPVAFFSVPVAMLWIKKHYAALEQGHGKPGGSLGAGEERLKLLEQQNHDLLERVQNLESIVCALEEPVRPKALPSRNDAIQKMVADR